MLKDLFAGIARFKKSDPKKMIENLKEPVEENKAEAS